MNYHIITQDKFFNGYIEDIYELQLEHENVFWVQGEPREQSYLTTNHPVEYLGNDKLSIIQRLLQLQPTDKLFVSWYYGIVAQAILESGIKNQLYVYMMGGEFYADPLSYHYNWLYDRKTISYLKKIGYLPCVKFTRLNPLHWYRIIGDIKRVAAWRKSTSILYAKKMEQIARINYIVLSQKADEELEFVKSLYPNCRAKHAYGLFDQNFDIASKMPTKQDKTKDYKILIGNSADPTNNYVDAYHFVKKNLHETYQIYSVLSYGDILGKRVAINAGQKIFKNKFCPIVDYMNRQNYLDFINGMDVIVMYHNRQQAVGNIMTSLVLGKPVFMKSMNVVYKMLKNIGVQSIYDVDDIGKYPLKYYIDSAKDKRQETITIIEQVYSKKLRLKYLKELLS